jgi:Tfp pilus assembly protein PilF
MNKIKFGVLVLTTLFFSTAINKQTIEEGKKFVDLERLKSAKNVFQKLIDANPNNTAAIYWLGITLIHEADFGKKELTDAKELYRVALEKNPNNPLLIAGMGHVESHEGKPQDARNRYETALSLSQNKDIEVLTAVGMANTDYDNKNGDPVYGIEKLKLATTLKKFKDPAVYVYMGDGYRMLMDGGNAQNSYQAALTLDPTYVRAYYRIGKIYQTQGVGQEEIYMKYYNEAIAKDPTFGPVYKNLSDLNYATDVTKSAMYLDKYLANCDDDPKNCFYRASMKYAQGLFSESVVLADQCIAASPNPYPNLFGLQGFAYFKLGDSVKARDAFEKYLRLQAPEKIGPADYSIYSETLLKFPGNEVLAGTYIEKAVAADSTELGKIGLLKTIAVRYENQKLYKDAADWYKKIVNIRKDTKKIDLYNAGYNYFRSGDYQSSINMFNIYSAKFPDDIFSYYMIGKANWAIDSTMEQGLANPSFEKAIQVGQVDKVKNKNQLIGSYKYFVAYYANIKKDKATAIAYCDSVLLIDPADADALNNKVAIEAMNMNPPPAPKQPKPAGNKPAGEKPGTPKPAAPAPKK